MSVAQKAMDPGSPPLSEAHNFSDVPPHDGTLLPPATMSLHSAPHLPILEVVGVTVGITAPEDLPGQGFAATGKGREKAVGLATNRVSFTVKRGKTLCLVGESGCGKSVTALSILRLLPEPPARVLGGCALFEGKDLLTMSPAELLAVRGNAIGMVFQDPSSSLNPVMRVGKQIAEGLRLHKKLSLADAHMRAVEMLDRVGIPDPVHRAGDYPHQMSGGMRQRVMIAMALACSPRLLIADEPTTALDVTVQKQILGLIHRLVNEAESGLLLISHDLGVVASVADEVAVMYAGSIVEFGPAKEILTAPRHPYTEGLLLARKGLVSSPVQADTLPRSRQLNAIPGIVPSLWAKPLGCPFHPRCSRALVRCREKEPPALPRKGRPGAHQVSCWQAER